MPSGGPSAEAGLRAEARPHSSTLTLVSVAKELTKPGWSSRLQSWEAGTRPALPWSYVWPCTMRALSPFLPCLATNPTPPSSLAPSSFLSGLGKEEGRGRHLYLDGADSLLGGQRQPFIRDRGGSGISPAGMRPCRLESLWEGRRYPGPKGVTSPGSSPEVLVSTLCSLRSSLPSEPQRGGKLPRHLLPCQLLGLESCRPIPRWPLEWKVERKPLNVGNWVDSRPSPPPQGKPSPIFPSCPHLGNPFHQSLTHPTMGAWEMERVGNSLRDLGSNPSSVIL